jgi:hypothetical protein
VWASGALFAAAFVILVPVAIWIYALVFAFSSLWFSHYGLAALQALRAEDDLRAAQATPVELDLVLDAPLSSPPLPHDSQADNSHPPMSPDRPR